MTPEIGILDLGMGNLSSLFNAVYESGFDPVLLSTDQSLDSVTHLFLPGVGSFATAMGELGPFKRHVEQFLQDGRPLLGVCLGMQLLASRVTEGSPEGEGVAGLGCIPGRVDRLPTQEGVRLPHVGWNAVQFRRHHPLLENVKTDRDFYFVHSYCMSCDREEDVLGETEYGAPFTSVIARGNVAGVQFHPEKSQINGLRIIENFCHWDGQC